MAGAGVALPHVFPSPLLTALFGGITVTPVTDRGELHHPGDTLPVLTACFRLAMLGLVVLPKALRR